MWKSVPQIVSSQTSSRLLFASSLLRLISIFAWVLFLTFRLETSSTAKIYRIDSALLFSPKRHWSRATFSFHFYSRKKRLTFQAVSSGISSASAGHKAHKKKKTKRMENPNQQMFHSIFVYLWVFGTRRAAQPNPHGAPTQCISAGQAIQFHFQLFCLAVVETAMETTHTSDICDRTLQHPCWMCGWRARCQPMDSSPGIASCCSLVPIHFVKWIKIKKLMLHTDCKCEWWTLVSFSLPRSLKPAARLLSAAFEITDT